MSSDAPLQRFLAVLQITQCRGRMLGGIRVGNLSVGITRHRWLRFPSSQPVSVNPVWQLEDVSGFEVVHDAWSIFDVRLSTTIR